MLKIKLLVILLMIASSTGLLAQSSIQDDFREFTEGEKIKFSTVGHPKSRSINIQLEIPRNWEKKEGERPHIVQTFSSSGGGGTAKVATINITPLPPDFKGFSDDEIAGALFNPKLIEETLPAKSKLLIAKPTKYDGEPGIFLYYVTEMERSGVNFASLVVSHRFIYQKATVDVSVAYSVLVSSAQERLTQQQGEAFLALAIQVGNSIILPDKYIKR